MQLDMVEIKFITVHDYDLRREEMAILHPTKNIKKTEKDSSAVDGASASCKKRLGFESRDKKVLPLILYHGNGASTG